VPVARLVTVEVVVGAVKLVLVVEEEEAWVSEVEVEGAGLTEVEVGSGDFLSLSTVSPRTTRAAAKTMTAAAKANRRRLTPPCRRTRLLRVRYGGSSGAMLLWRNQKELLPVDWVRHA